MILKEQPPSYNGVTKNDDIFPALQFCNVCPPWFTKDSINSIAAEATSSEKRRRVELPVAISEWFDFPSRHMLDGQLWISLFCTLWINWMVGKYLIAHYLRGIGNPSKDASIEKVQAIVKLIVTKPSCSCTRQELFEWKHSGRTYGAMYPTLHRGWCGKYPWKCTVIFHLSMATLTFSLGASECQKIKHHICIQPESCNIILVILCQWNCRYA